MNWSIALGILGVIAAGDISLAIQQPRVHRRTLLLTNATCLCAVILLVTVALTIMSTRSFLFEEIFKLPTPITSPLLPHVEDLSKTLERRISFLFNAMWCVVGFNIFHSVLAGVAGMIINENAREKANQSAKGDE